MADTPAQSFDTLLTRREMLRSAGLLAAAAMVPACLQAGGQTTVPEAMPSKSIAAAGPQRPTVALRATRTWWELRPGLVVEAWTYNGQVPGPLIRVREGERVRVLLENRLPEATTIHWHGVDVPPAMDGVPGVTQDPVRPGETFVYEFEARPSGTRWYHTHMNGARQLDGGLYGPLIIDPATAGRRVDREYVLVLGSWVTGQAAAVPWGQPGATGGGMMGGMGVRMGGMQEMMGIAGPAYDTFTINGKAFPATRPLRVRGGERVRLRVVNASAHRHFDVRLDGHTLWVTHTDGHPLASPVPVDALSIAPAERYDVEFTADTPGKWPFHALDPAVEAAGLKTVVVYDGYQTAPESRDERPTAALRWWSYPLGRGRDILPPASGTGRRWNLILGWGMMMAPRRWTINGQTYPDTQPLRVRAGDLVAVRVFNMSPDSHPMHLHGQSFRVRAINGHPLPQPLVKDTVDVDPMGTVDLEIVAHNPGRWLFHCHKVQHMEGGLATLLDVT